MKILLFVLMVAFTRSAYAQNCVTQVPLAGHMKDLSYLVDTLYAGYNDPNRKLEMEKTVQSMRGHLAAALVQVPSKIKQLQEPALSLSILEYQEYITKVLELSLRLERAFRLDPSFEDQKMKRDKVLREALETLSQTIAIGHEKFRNRRM